MYLHGGPGSGCTPGARLNFDLQRHLGVLFDQRAAGRSTPHAADDVVHWDSIDMDHHVRDIEQLRVHLGITRWIVFGLYNEKSCPQCARSITKIFCIAFSDLGGSAAGRADASKARDI